MRRAVFLASAFMSSLLGLASRRLLSTRSRGGSRPLGLARRVPRVAAGRIGQHGATVLAGACVAVGVERGDHVAQAALDIVAPEIDLMQLGAARGTEPGDAVELARLTRPLDDEADAAGRSPRRVIHLLRQNENLALFDTDAAFAPVLDHMDEDVAGELIEDLVERIDVEIVARVRPLDDLEDEVGTLEHLLV